MPKPYQTAIPGTRIAETPLASVKPAVVANPTDQFAAPTPDWEVQGFVQALSALNPSLTRYIDLQEKTEAEQGRIERAKGVPMPTGRSAAFVDGYVRADMEIAADNDAKQLAAKYKTEYDPSSGKSLDDFVKEFYVERTKGMSDPGALEAYNATFSKHTAALRQQHSDSAALEVVQRHRANVSTQAQKLLDKYFPATLEGPADVAGYQQELAALKASTPGISGAEWNEIEVELLMAAGSHGNTAVFASTYAPRADGTPGLASIPKYAAKVANAEQEAHKVAHFRRQDEDNAARRERTVSREQAFAPILIGVIEGKLSKQEAETQLIALMHKQPELFGASDVYQAVQQLHTLANREEKVEQVQAEGKMLPGIEDGSVQEPEVRRALQAGDITPQQYSRLVGHIASRRRQINAEARAEARSKRADSGALYRSPQYTQGVKYINEAVPELDPMDTKYDPAMRDQVSMLKANAQREFSMRAAGLSPEELPALANEIATNMRKEVEARSKMAPEKRTPPDVLYSDYNKARQASKVGAYGSPEQERRDLEYHKSQLKK